MPQDFQPADRGGGGPSVILKVVRALPKLEDELETVFEKLQKRLEGGEFPADSSLVELRRCLILQHGIFES